MHFKDFELHRLQLRPGDRLVVHCPARLSRQQAEAIKAALGEWAPGVPAAVLDGGMKLGVLSDQRHQAPTEGP